MKTEGLILAEINPFLWIVFAWATIFFFFAGISFLLWRKGNRIKEKLKINPEIRFFENVEIHVVSKSKLSYNLSIPCKIDVAVDKEKIYFLPGRFNVFLLTNLIPSSVNFKLGRVEAEPQFSKTVQLKFDTGSMQTFFKPFYLLRTEFECTLTCQDMKQREELLYLIAQNQPNDG